MTTGWNLASPSKNRWSGPAPGAAYGTAGGLILIAVLVSVLTDDPARTIGTPYNKALRHDLDLPSSAPPSEPPPEQTSALEPARAATVFGLGYTFHF